MLWKEGGLTTEIMRPGPPGQASLYFNDPFENHLEIITLGLWCGGWRRGVPDRSWLGYSWGRDQRR
jgi:hypothetical protein